VLNLIILNEKIFIICSIGCVRNNIFDFFILYLASRYFYIYREVIIDLYYKYYGFLKFNSRSRDRENKIASPVEYRVRIA